MHIKHHGAVDGVTGSCHELELADGSSLLIDCGLFQGAEAGADGAGAAHLEIGFDITPVRALVLTHVHIDHCGRLPYLLAAGYRGPILCSPASSELLPLVLEDALEIGVTRNRKLIEQVLAVVKERTIALPYGQWNQVTDKLRIRLQPAGHILGSAYVECDVHDSDKGMRSAMDASANRGTSGQTDQSATGSGNQRGDSRTDKERGQSDSGSGDKSGRRVVFSGDLGAPDTPLLPGPQPPERADVLVLESTYGDHNHQDRSARAERLRAAIEHALADGGTVLIPAFSIGRTQELLYELEELFHQLGETAATWRDLQIVLDSPLAADFTRGYQRLRKHWDAEAKSRLSHGRHPLAFEQLITVDSHDAHQRMVNYLAHSRQPAVVIAASGMCAGGRMVNYLKAMLGDPRHDVLFVGYQAAGTPGRDIQRYGPRGGYVMLDGERHNIRAQIHTIGGYSAHADQRNLIDFVTGIPAPPQEIRLIHGDTDAKAALRDALRKALPTGSTQVLIPVGDR
ncbi:MULTISPECIES: MBL fold metallo-hydrolase RNA specificity domain-containing protein [Thiorhodovibrio]|uniref:MBL fold metallo-hydrolase RNA specificity domain-containing protein n=1 Tax=Thiorhodovibrio TaxID=61593 RepID=UPI001914157A|nr:MULTISPECIES: MBL fold metallo-hydrolase [Thiorhodovibrio]MBK5967653.1 MBL fold hydrolase [Thiorhodovibrio winogradskyi]WPL11600.1 Ribonuclease [Thiorhodovibrio litoralis]